MEYSSIIPRQLAPTVGQEAAGARNRARSTLNVIGESVAVGMINYFGNLPFIVPDTFTPAVRGITRSAIIPIGAFHFYVGWTDDESVAEEHGVTTFPTRPVLLADNVVEE